MLDSSRPVQLLPRGRSATAVTCFVDASENWEPAGRCGGSTGAGSGEPAVPRPAFPSLEPAAALGLCPAPAGTNGSGFHWLSRDLDPICSLRSGWQLSTSPPLVLPYTHPSSLRRDGDHSVPRGLGAPWNPHCCCQLRACGLRRLGFYTDSVWIAERECHFIKTCPSSSFFCGGLSAADVVSDEICRLVIQTCFSFWYISLRHTSVYIDKYIEI